ncbi:MAG: FGGY-family carbohydrate kinase [Gammaproteobacteria bacterium]
MDLVLHFGILTLEGVFHGITQDTSIEDIVTAAFHSITFQTKEITDVLESNNIEINKLLVDGGMVANETFCQVLSDTLQKVIIRPENVESTALGACKVAMIASGETDINLGGENKTFDPDDSLQKVYDASLDAWRSYIKINLS